MPGSDSGLKHLKVLTELGGLELVGRHVTDDDLEHIKELRNLQSLTLYETKGITEAGLEHLKALTNCEIVR